MATAAELNASAGPRPCCPPPVDDRPFGPAQTALVAAATTSLSATTVAGNALVMLSVLANPRLRAAHGRLAASLAAADLLVGLVVVNLRALYLLRGRWPLANALCDAWLVLDHVTGGAAVLHLLLISLDRYLRMTRGGGGGRRRRRGGGGGAALLMAAAAWLLPAALWAPAIVCWQADGGGRRLVPEGRCYTRLLASPAVTLATTLPTFYLPAVVMVTLYGRLSAASRGRLNAHLPPAPPPRASGASVRDLLLRRRGSGGPASRAPGDDRRRRRVVARERRVTRTILAVVLAFVVTRTPYNVLAVAAALGRLVVPDGLWAAGCWLRYAGSALNPCCHALCDRAFRAAFCGLLRCRRPRPLRAPGTRPSLTE